MQAHLAVTVPAHSQAEPQAAPSRPPGSLAGLDRPIVRPSARDDALARTLRASVQRRAARDAAELALAEPTLQRCKTKKPQKMSLGAFYAQTSTPKPVSAWSKPLPSAALVGTSVPSPAVSVVAAPDVSAYTSALEAWSPAQGHGGKNGKSLSTAQVHAIVAYVRSAYSRSDNVILGRGEGSGQWSDRVQLKVIHRQVRVGGGKNATYHITLRPSVYDALVEVPELGD